jgi:hypothetical protein
LREKLFPMECECGYQAVTKVSQKPGPNCGREFFTCPVRSQNPTGGEGCGFFHAVDGKPWNAKRARSTNCPPKIARSGGYAQATSSPTGHGNFETSSKPKEEFHATLRHSPPWMDNVFKGVGKPRPIDVNEHGGAQPPPPPPRPSQREIAMLGDLMEVITSSSRHSLQTLNKAQDILDNMTALFEKLSKLSGDEKPQECVHPLPQPSSPQLMKTNTRVTKKAKISVSDAVANAAKREDMDDA